MTGGTVAILGAIGDNFAAGMTGGMAFVYDREGLLATHLNPDSAIAVPLRSAHWEAVVRKLVEEHFARTESVRAHDILADWDLTKASFVQICPKETIARLKHPLDDSALAAGEAAE
jgi:glutamate synthase (NADPH/NADH) large chain